MAKKKKPSKKKAARTTTTVMTTTTKKTVSNPRAQTVDQHDVDELILFIDNDEPLYRQWQAIVKNLWKHKAKGRYDSARAVDGFMHLTDAAGRKYLKEFGPYPTDHDFNMNTTTRRKAAEVYVQSFENNWRDEHEFMPAAAKNPSRRYDDAADWPHFVLDGVIETYELPDDTPSDITPKLKAALDRYQIELFEVLEEIVQRYPPKNGQNVYDVQSADADYLVFMTLNGEGVGIWDGRWEHLWDDADIEKIDNYLENSKLGRAASGTGSGWLNTAFENAAYENDRLYRDEDDREENPASPDRAHILAARLAGGLS